MYIYLPRCLCKSNKDKYNRNDPDVVGTGKHILYILYQIPCTVRLMK